MSADRQFECRACLFPSDRDDLSYDQLGYAICPVCGHSHNPAEETRPPANTA